MNAVRPLPDDDLDIGPVGDFSEFSAEGQAIIAAALDRAQDGGVRAVPHSEIEALVERQRLAAMKAG
ncbi:MAG: hypothetical protein U0359_16915 [Byssovorax sp.]